MLLALLLGPQIGQILLPIQEVCAEESRDCCDPNGVCDVNCILCVCCTAHPIASSSMAGEDGLARPSAHPIAVRAVAPPSAPPSDILHIPKSA